MEGQKITSNARIVASLPTVKELLDKGAIPILASHLGRPKGLADKKFTMEPVAEEVQRVLGPDVKVVFLPKSIDGAGVASSLTKESIRQKVAEIRSTQPNAKIVFVLENLRYFHGEEQDDTEYAKRLASLADRYVNDAFGRAHRAHSSTHGIAFQIGHENAAVGRLMEKELRMLTEAKSAKLAIIGGSKIADKIGILEAFLGQPGTKVIIGGAMANTFLKAMGYNVGKSLVENDKLDLARKLLKTYGDRIILPLDVVVAKSINAASDQTQIVSIDKVPNDEAIFDLGVKDSKSWEVYKREIESAGGALVLGDDSGGVVWNGPMGVFEKRPFAKGTAAVARCSSLKAAAGSLSAAAIPKMPLPS